MYKIVLLKTILFSNLKYPYRCHTYRYKQIHSQRYTQIQVSIYKLRVSSSHFPTVDIILMCPFLRWGKARKAMPFYFFFWFPASNYLSLELTWNIYLLVCIYFLTYGWFIGSREREKEEVRYWFCFDKFHSNSLLTVSW